MNFYGGHYGGNVYANDVVYFDGGRSNMWEFVDRVGLSVLHVLAVEWVRFLVLH